MEDYLKLFPSNASVLAAYSSISTSWVLLKTAYDQIIPRKLQDFLVSKFKYYFSRQKSYATFIIDPADSCGIGRNELFDASRAYLSTKIGPRNRKIKIGKSEQQKNVSTAIAEGGNIRDTFQGITITWTYYLQDQQRNDSKSKPPKSYYEITFDSKHWSKVHNEYLIHVLNTHKALMQKEKVLKLYTRLDFYYGNKGWKPVDFHHPASFDTLALDPELKKSIIDDLDRFLERKEFYKRVGKAWKRGYLLYGPPGTGKSTLIAAMANYLNFNIYDLELASISCDTDLRKLLLTITNRSILIIEDIDCNSEVHDRSKTINVKEEKQHYRKTFTLSTLLNCIDGLWSSCGEARIIVFTTNHKEVLDPALLRPGRMDMHIHMSYCTIKAFRVLAFNYLGIHEHKLYQEIDGLIENTNVTPASLAEELTKSDDADVALGEVVNFLKRKKREQEQQIEEKNKKSKLKRKIKNRGLFLNF
ncbi:hypothetical protein JCGZ_24010 [Jatropha curcas]|uniref:AAA+ ATPase domain-containing protein n=1 Tax=Jatropha curcas TaxID=180498 RepID=A0A067K1S4_JATCU|nr:AAA-ATPase At2g18193 [Jatropha curcas]KDP25709.1 hypothetical protein JCGZ_24010 [Jatropha curcas]